MASELETAVAVALRGRLTIALDVLGHDDDGTVEELASRLAQVAARAEGEDAGSVAWLAFTAFFGRFPTEVELARFRRELLLQTEPIRALLVTGQTIDRRGPAALRDLKIVADRPVVDVGHAATSDHATGIQRVIRQTIPHWVRRGVELVAWHADDRGWRELDGTERARVGVPPEVHSAGALVVPWRTTVILPEVSSVDRASTLAALAAHSGSRVALIGYDLIPIVSAELVDAAESERMGQFLAVVKSAAVVAGISESASSEFRGYAHALGAQGLTGPEVVTVPLAEEPVPATGHERVEADPPLILCVGSHEPRKNHLAILTAAELAWRSGADFELVLAGGRSWDSAEFDALAGRLIAEGRPLTLETSVSDAGLARLYRQARCSIFASFNEGFGLPIAESIAMGTPVITADFGSQREVGEGHGALLVDPRDARAIAAALTRLLADDALHAALAAEAAATPHGSWSEYAARLAALLV